MSYRIEINSVGIWIPFNTRYYSSKEEAESTAKRIARMQLGGNNDLIRIRKARV